MLFSLIIGFLLGAAALLFILENTTVVALSFLQFQFQLPISMLVLLTLLFGIVITLLLLLPGAIGDGFRMRRLRKNNEALARETEAHRQVAENAKAQLINAQTPNPDVIDLTRA